MGKVFGDIELVGGGSVINLSANSVETDPAFDPADEGLIIYHFTDKTYKYNNGTSWVEFQISLTSSTELIETLGSNWINPDFSFNPADFNEFDNISGLDANDNLFQVLVTLDNAITEAKTVVTLRGVSLNFTPESLSSGNILYFDGNNFVPGTINDVELPTFTLSQVDDVSIIEAANDQLVVFRNGAWVNASVFYKYEEFSGTLNVFTINHSLGAQFCHVTIIDMSLATPATIDPSEIVSVEFNTTSTLTVTLTGNKPITVIVMTIAVV